MKKLELGQNRELLKAALHVRMLHCQEGLIEIITQDDFEVSGGNWLRSENLGKHFSIAAYKAMQSASIKLRMSNELTFETLDELELTQLLKATGCVGERVGEEVVDFLTDALFWNVLRR